MLDYITSFSRSGIRDWVIQRVSAVILAIYTIVMLAFFISHPHVQYPVWHAFFAHGFVRLLSFLALLSIVAHAWIGLWIVLTDYVKPWCVRFTLQTLAIIGLLSLLAWGVDILWITGV